MEKITLQPGVWTWVRPARFIQSKSNQSGVRMHVGTEPPALDTDAYFVTAEFDLKPISMVDMPISSNIYMMPDEDMPVDVVVL